MIITDLECLVIDYLNSSNLGISAFYDVPAERPESFVVVERTGGDLSNRVVESAVFDMQCWSSIRALAAQYANNIRNVLLDITTLENVSYINITSFFRDKDLESGTPRYHIVFELIFND